MSSNPCQQARRLWGVEFDTGAPVPEAIAAHLRHCAGCREYQTQAVLLREQLATTPLPAPSLDRDQELLAQLQPADTQTRGSFWASWWKSLRSPALPALGAVGFAAFAVTLVTAHLLTVLPTDRTPRVAPGGASARSVDHLPHPDLVERWLASPQPRMIPLRNPARDGAAPVPESGSGAEGPVEPLQRGSTVPAYHRQPGGQLG
jgi:hypothetical protein